jgi:uncharacterized protein (TIRG00374 family)
LWLALPLALAWAMRGVTVRQVINGLRQLTAGELIVLAAVNLLVVLAFSGRWWVLLRARGQHLPYLALSGYRLAAFAVSYFTPGTHFGGEPLQVHLLQRRHAVPAPVATASVVLDKAIELIANFAFLAIGLAIVVRLGLQPAGSGLLLRIASLALAVLPTAYLVAAWRGHRPATWMLSRLGWDIGEAAWKRNVSRRAEATESEVSAAARHSPGGLAAGALFSILSWVLLLAEWALAMRFLEIGLTPSQIIAVVTAARLALFVPLPGAAGALEASLVLALTTLGVSSTQALSLAVVIRLRDIAFGAFGLWLGGWLSGAPAAGMRSPSQAPD